MEGGDAFPVWLGSVGTVRTGHGRNSRVHLGKSAWSPTTSAACKSIGIQKTDPVIEDSRLHALIVVQLADVVHPMTQLNENELEQLSLWHSIAQQDLYSTGKCYRFNVLHCMSFQSVSLMQYFQRSSRGWFIELEVGQPQTLYASLCQQAQDVPDWFPDVAPRIALRLPGPYSKLIEADMWSSFLLPDTPRRRGGASAMYVNWKLLGIETNQLPSVPEALLQVISDTHVGLERQIVLNALTNLKQFATTLDQSEAGLQHYISTARCVHSLQSLADSVDPMTYRNAIHCTFGREQENAYNSHQFKAAFVVKAMMFANCLTSASVFKDALLSALRVALPAVAIPIFTEVINSSSQSMPQKSTISVWRTILDGADMLCQRLEYQDVGEDEFIRFLMADSSDQHGHHFEMIRFLEILRSKSAAMMLASADLANLWANTSEDDDEAVVLEDELLHVLSDGMCLRTLPLMTLGSGLQTLFHKFSTIMYALYLVAGTT